MFKGPKHPDQITCHRTGHRKLCKAKRDTCRLWMALNKKDPITGGVTQEWGCGDTWNTILLIEQTQRIEGVQAATESFRNEMVAANNRIVALEAAKLARPNGRSVKEIKHG